MKSIKKPKSPRRYNGQMGNGSDSTVFRYRTTIKRLSLKKFIEK